MSVNCGVHLNMNNDLQEAAQTMAPRRSALSKQIELRRLGPSSLTQLSRQNDEPDWREIIMVAAAPRSCLVHRAIPQVMSANDYNAPMSACKKDEDSLNGLIAPGGCSPYSGQTPRRSIPILLKWNSVPARQQQRQSRCRKPYWSHPTARARQTAHRNGGIATASELSPLQDSNGVATSTWMM